MFESPTFLRRGNKAVLAEELWKMTSANMTHLASAEEVQFILDAGALLQKIPWPRGST